MGLFDKLDLREAPTIDWDMTPEYTFGTFESWGGKERIRSKRERIYYFFIDNWGESPKLCLMERGIKHARIVAEILAPMEMLGACVEKQGRAVFDKSFAIDRPIREWIVSNILETDDDSKVVPLTTATDEETVPCCELPRREEVNSEIMRVILPSERGDFTENDVVELTRQYDLFDAERNFNGSLSGYLADNGDGLTVTDLVTGLMWQRQGLDIMSYRMMTAEVAALNEQRFAGYSDWRLPSLAEALSLVSPEKSSLDLYLHPVFSAKQPFIFANATRRPGGYWFVDYRQGRAYWASGTIPGGFGRLCRTDERRR